MKSVRCSLVTVAFVGVLHLQHLLPLCRTMIRNKKSYSVGSTQYFVRIKLLDTTTVDFNLTPNNTGGDCLNRVAQVLEPARVRLEPARVRLEPVVVCQVNLVAVCGEF